MSTSWFADPSAATAACALLAAISQAISSVQVIANRALFERAGLLDWGVLRAWYGTAGIRASVASALPRGYAVVAGLGLIKLAASVAVIVTATRGGSLAGPLLVMTVVNMALSVRIPVGMTGADYMGGIVIAALMLVEWSGTGAQPIGLSFIALQACVAYLTAGVGKAPHRGWRDGSFMRELFATASFGHPRFAAVLVRSEGTARWIGRCIVVFECLFPLVLFVPPGLAMMILAVGFAFHLATAVIMGLNTFVWAFPATYPAILFLNGAIHARLMTT